MTFCEVKVRVTLRQQQISSTWVHQAVTVKEKDSRLCRPACDQTRATEARLLQCKVQKPLISVVLHELLKVTSWIQKILSTQVCREIFQPLLTGTETHCVLSMRSCILRMSWRNHLVTGCLTWNSK